MDTGKYPGTIVITDTGIFDLPSGTYNCTGVCVPRYPGYRVRTYAYLPVPVQAACLCVNEILGTIVPGFRYRYKLYPRILIQNFTVTLPAGT